MIGLFVLPILNSLITAIHDSSISNKKQTFIDIEDLTNHIRLFLQDSKYYLDLSKLSYKDEFVSFINIVNLNIGAEERELLERHLVDIQSK
ncbi:hypothetical protein ACE4V3_05880 (plasmid) [Borrelia recurrentis]|uniref:hypothetical protein n=1 Tax=Borrelia recurrentis TaxID=44449 RepID=UPI000321F2F1|nr:hypothetical protein [Borrelia recurrentis]